MGSAGTLPQASSASPQPGRSTGSASTQSKVGSTHPYAVSVSPSLPGRNASILPQARSASPQSGESVGSASALPWEGSARPLFQLVGQAIQALPPRQAGIIPLNLEAVQATQALPLGLLGVLAQRGENTLEDTRFKWVINISSKPLTKAQRSLLAKGPNYTVTPKHLPNLEYISAIEAVCTKLNQQEVEELRAIINRALRASHPPNLI